MMNDLRIISFYSFGLFVNKFELIRVHVPISIKISLTSTVSNRKKIRCVYYESIVTLIQISLKKF